MYWSLHQSNTMVYTVGNNSVNISNEVSQYLDLYYDTWLPLKFLIFLIICTVYVLDYLNACLKFSILVLDLFVIFFIIKWYITISLSISLIWNP